jgi:hypothetical protein
VTVTDTTSTDAAIAFDTSGGELDSCTIDVTGTDADYHLEVGNGGTGAFAITLTDVTFTGTPGTDKVHVTNTSGTTTISINGTTTLVAGDVTSEGATVSIVSSPVYQSVVVSGFTAGSRIQIYDTTNSVELFNGTASSGNTVVSGSTATWTDPTAAAGNRAIRVRVSYVSGATADTFQELSGLTCGTTAGTASVTYPITPESDLVYNAIGVDGSTVTGMSIDDAAFRFEIDAGTIVTYGTDDVLVVDGRRMYSYESYWLFTEAGIRDESRFIKAPDAANLRFVAFKLFNGTSSPVYPVMINNAYVVDDATGVIASMIDYSGGNIFAAPDHVVNNIVTVGGANIITGDISTVLAAIPSADDTADATLSDPRALTVAKFVALK